MRKIILLLSAVLLLSLPVAISEAHYEGYKSNIKEGITDIATFPKEMVDSVKDEVTEAKFKPFGLVGGVLKGTYNSLKQLGRGVLRVVTFNMEEDNSLLKPFRKE